MSSLSSRNRLKLCSYCLGTVKKKVDNFTCCELNYLHLVQTNRKLFTLFPPTLGKAACEEPNTWLSTVSR